MINEENSAWRKRLKGKKKLQKLAGGWWILLLIPYKCLLRISSKKNRVKWRRSMEVPIRLVNAVRRAETEERGAGQRTFFLSLLYMCSQFGARTVADGAGWWSDALSLEHATSVYEEVSGKETKTERDSVFYLVTSLLSFLPYGSLWCTQRETSSTLWWQVKSIINHISPSVSKCNVHDTLQQLHWPTTCLVSALLSLMQIGKDHTRLCPHWTYRQRWKQRRGALWNLCYLWGHAVTGALRLTQNCHINFRWRRETQGAKVLMVKRTRTSWRWPGDMTCLECVPYHEQRN